MSKPAPVASGRCSMSERGQDVGVEKPHHPPPLDWESIGKLGAAVLGLMYVVGILTVNTYLYRIGATEFSLVQAQYIYTGALTIAPICLCSLSPIFAFFMLRARDIDEELKRSQRKSQSRPTSINLVGFKAGRWINVVVFALLPLTLILLTDPAGDIYSRIWVGVQMYWISGSTGIISFGLVLVLSGRQKLRTRQIPRSVLAFSIGIFLAIYTSWYLSFFTERIYTNVPGQFGGGKPTIGQFLFFTERVFAAHELGIELTDSSNLSKPMSLLFESDKSFVVLAHNRRVTRLSKELIAAVQVVE
jgi:hypothetical protein